MTDMVDLLMCEPTIILQDIVILCADGGSKFLHDRLWVAASAFHRSRISALHNALPHQNLGQLVVGYVCQLDAMVLGDDQLHRWNDQYVKTSIDSCHKPRALC